MNLVLFSPKWIDSSLSINHWHRDENCLKYFNFFIIWSLRQKCPNTEFFLVRIFVFRIWTLKFHPQKKNINTNQKFYGLEIRLNPFIYRYPETKIFHFSKRTRWSKVSNAFWESTNVMLVCICLSIPIKTKSFKCARQINVCWIVCWVMMQISFFSLRYFDICGKSEREL